MPGPAIDTSIMGKGKPKKSAPTAVGEEFSSPSDPPHCTCGHEHPRAADGHNVDGWTDEDIRVYNELLTERAKLEKEKIELEQKSARHQAERALLNEDAAAYDKLFKPDLGGEYKFVGKSSCCLDFGENRSVPSQGSKSICHHEVCGRAKTQGISWMEVDTIKYYHSRITSEKSQRMKNALRKQRDVELARVKKEDEEEIALRNRKSALNEKLLSSEGQHSPAASPNTSEFSLLDAFGSKDSLLSPKDNAILEAARENELVVKRIRSRLDKIRYDVHAGRVTASDARMKLDQANKEMAEAERKNNTFKEMIFTAGGVGQDDLLAASSSASTTLSRALTKSLANSSTDAFSQALSVMKGFFSASDPRDVQAAISDLRSVLEINGPMSPVLQKSFQALEEMLAKPNSKGFSVDLPTKDGQTLTLRNVVEVLLHLRNPEDRATLKSTAEKLKLDDATLKKNEQCLKIEQQAIKKMNTVMEGFDLGQAKLIYEQLKDVKEKAAMKAPIPPLSDHVLEKKMNELLYMRTMRELFRWSQKGGNEKELAATITSMIITYSEKDKSKFSQTLARLEEEAHRLSEDTNLHYDSMKVVMDAFGAVHNSISATLAKATSVKGESRVQAESKPKTLADHASQDREQLEDIAAASRDKHYLEPEVVNVLNAANDLANVQSETQIASDAPATPDVTIETLQESLDKAFTSGEILDDSTEVGRLNKDLAAIYATPDGHEEERKIDRINQYINLMAGREVLPVQDKGKMAGKGAKASATGHTSKFQEDLTTGDEPSPPPYSANEGRARTAKIKQVAVNTPQIQDRAAEAANPTASQMTTQDQTTFEQRTADVSYNLKKMRKELQTLTRLPGLDGARATRLRRQLDSVMEQVNDLDTEVNQGYPSNENIDKGKGKEQESTAAASSTQVDASHEPTKKSKKKQPKTSALGLSTENPYPNTPPLFPPPTFDDRLSEREETVRVQLYNMKTNLSILRGSPPPGRAIDYGIPLAFDGITLRLETQLSMHVSSALCLCGVNEWTGLEAWINGQFKRVANGEYRSV